MQPICTTKATCKLWHYALCVNLQSPHDVILQPGTVYLSFTTTVIFYWIVKQFYKHNLFVCFVFLLITDMVLRCCLYQRLKPKLALFTCFNFSWPPILKLQLDLNVSIYCLLYFWIKYITLDCAILINSFNEAL